MKYWINGLTIILIGILIVLGVLVGMNFNRLSNDFKIHSMFDKESPPLYRFMVIVDGSDMNYIKELELGMNKAALDYSVVYEMWYFDGERKEEELIRQFDIGVESQVDGIIIQAFKDERFDTILSKANYRGIPVTTIGSDIPKTEKVSYFSCNQYQLGTRLGVLLRDYFNFSNVTNGTIVMLQNDNATDGDKAVGIKEEISQNFVIKPEKIIYQGINKLNAEGMTRSIISMYDNLVAIICSSGEETLGVIKAIKDTDKMNDIIVIGSDDDDNVLNYIERGIILATVVSDNQRLGYESIVDMVHYNNGQFVSQYKDISVRIITKNSLDDYKVEVGERYEEIK